MPRHLTCSELTRRCSFCLCRPDLAARLPHPLDALSLASQLTHLTLARNDVAFSHTSAVRALSQLLELELCQVRLSTNSVLSPLTTLTKLRLTAVGEVMAPRAPPPPPGAPPPLGASFDARHLRPLTRLRDLHVRATEIQSASLKTIYSLPSLEALALIHNDVETPRAGATHCGTFRASHLAGVATLATALRALTVVLNPLIGPVSASEGAGPEPPRLVTAVMAVTRLTALHLECAHQGLPARDAAPLSRLVNLRALHLNAFSDGSAALLAHLKPLTALRWAELDGAHVPLVFLPALCAAKQLVASASRTRATSAAPPPASRPRCRSTPRSASARCATCARSRLRRAASRRRSRSAHSRLSAPRRA
jgi:hypothetical protein